MVYQMGRAVWTRWLDVAALSGAIDLPGYSGQRRQYQACAWLPTKWDWIDPMKDASAEIVQIEAGLKSRTQAISERGYDAEQVDREIAAERKRELALGLDFRGPGSPAQGPGTASGSDGKQDGPEGDGAPEDTEDESNPKDDP
jgi:capsid protein